ncbi:MAG: hypothetical protein M1825_002568 [Sarcosagium campestre]|nr:MAG: hypothetical protein M1825_002568 [Sarcosagium campestre]
MAQVMPEETDALLTRLSQKPGVQSTLVLSRHTGAIVRTSGLITKSASGTANPDTASSSFNPSASTSGQQTSADSQGQELAAAYGDGDVEVSTRAEEVAGIVWAFVAAAGGLVKGLDGEDELKLLRLRTKKNELVIVPGGSSTS